MLLQLDFSGETPIYQQIRNQIVLGIASGALRPGERLPTIRALADEIGINMMTVNKAYQLLKQEGYIQADRRSGAVVSGEIPQDRALSPKAMEGLRLAVSEAKLHGIGEAELLKLCAQLYEEKEGETDV